MASCSSGSRGRGWGTPPQSSAAVPPGPHLGRAQVSHPGAGWRTAEARSARKPGGTRQVTQRMGSERAGPRLPRGICHHILGRDPALAYGVSSGHWDQRSPPAQGLGEDRKGVHKLNQGLGIRGELPGSWGSRGLRPWQVPVPTSPGFWGQLSKPGARGRSGGSA